jgi:hypothetical protein
MDVKLVFTLRKEHRLKIFGNTALGRISEPKAAKATGGWEKLNTERFRWLLSSPNLLQRPKQEE